MSRILIDSDDLTELQQRAISLSSQNEKLENALRALTVAYEAICKEFNKDPRELTAYRTGKEIT